MLEMVFKYETAIYYFNPISSRYQSAANFKVRKKNPPCDAILY